MKTLRILISLSVSIALYVVNAHEESAYEFRHWEKASADPDRIILTWTGDPATTQAITWRTDDSVSMAFAEIAVADASSRFDKGAKRLKAKTEALELGRHDKNAEIRTHYHSVVFEELMPETLYAYRVGDGNQRWSEWIQFKTAASEIKPVEFLYFGDAQNAVLSRWSRVMRAAFMKAPYANFTIHAGDMINRAHRDQEWAEWFKAGGWVHATVQSIVVPGNHEYDPFDSQEGDGAVNRLSMHWGPQFTLPTYEALPEAIKESAYFIDYQGIRIVALDSNNEIDAQAKWLDGVLANNPNAWTVLTFHHPIFSSGKSRDNKEKREKWKPIIDKYKVDLVLQGHDHTYARGHTPVRMTEEKQGRQVTSMYVNSVSGPKMYEFMKEGWDVYRDEGVVLDRKAENTQFFQVIRIDGNLLTYKAYTATGELYDAFQMKKNEDGSKELRDWSPDLGDERLFDNTMPYYREGF